MSTLTETIDSRIQNTVPMMIEDYMTSQTHNGLDGQQILGSDLANAPQTALTPATSGSLSSGGGNPLSTADSAILTNALLRLAQLESRLQSLGLLN